MSAAPSSPADRQKLKTALVEITNAYSRMDGEKDFIKETLDAAQEQFAIKKKVLTKLARTMYKRDYATLQAENSDFEDLYDILVEGKKNDTSPSSESDDE